MLESTNSYYLVITFFLLSTTMLQSLDNNIRNKDNDNKYPDNNNSIKINPYEFLHIIPNPDGTITRISKFFPTVPPNTSYDLSYSKDTLLNPKKNTWVRSYLPKNVDFSQPTKLPIILYVHGGGFVVLSLATPNFDRFCARMASWLGVIVVSVEYRLAPENRLPAAYEDVLEGLYWVRDGKDEWVNSYGDVLRFVIMGESAGGNIAYNVGLRASALVDALNPLVIKGMVLIQPFFGGVDRSGSELRLDESAGLPFVVTDLMWNLSLPIGTNRDYFYSNPFSGDGLDRIKRIRELGWRVAIVGCDGDPFFDRQVELSEWLKKQGVNVIGGFIKGHYHGVFVNDYDIAEKFFEFIYDDEQCNSVDNSRNWPDGILREAPIIAYTEKFIEAEKLQLTKYIEENYSKIRDVEREFANLNLELKLTTGSKNAAFEHLRKKIEVQNEKIRAAKIKEEQAKKVWEAALQVVKDEEAVKQKLCEDLNNLVQESSSSQHMRLEELKRRLKALNPGRASTCLMLNSAPGAVRVAMIPEANGVAVNARSQGKDDNIPTINAENQPPVLDGEGRGKKKNLLHGRGKWIGALPKGRGLSLSGWTGAGFDVDSRS